MTSPVTNVRAGSASAGETMRRSGRTMAVGTLASRGTGLVRTLIIASVVGSKEVGDAYNIANTLPNIVYELLLGGVLTSVVVPLLVQAAKADGDGGEAYAQRLLTLVTVVLGAASVIAVLLAPQIVGLYRGEHPAPGQAELSTELGRFFLPQILFYGVGATMGAILNTRGRFGAPMWTPVLNNCVVILTGGVFLLLPFSGPFDAETITTAQELTLGIGTTLGIVVQTAALLPSLRRSGFRWRPRFDFRHTGLATTGRLAGWVLLYVLVNQLGLIAVTKLAATALHPTGVTGGSSPASYSTYVYAFAIFQLPHAVVAVSVITALLPRMSRHAVDERFDLISADLSRGLRLASVVLVPATFGFLALHHPIAQALFHHGQTRTDSVSVIGWTLAAFAIGLVPFSAFQLQLRAFYALRDTRTPALINIWVNVTNVALDVALFLALPLRWKVPGLAVGYAASYAVGLALSSRVLSLRLGGLDGRRVVRTVVRLAVAAVGGGAVASVVAAVVTAFVGDGFVGSVVAVLAAVGLGGGFYGWVALRLRVRELTSLVEMAGSRVPLPRRG